MIANVHLSETWRLWSWNHWVETSLARYNEMTDVLKTWEDNDRPPLIVGGNFSQLPVGHNYRLMTRDLIDTLKSLGQDRLMTLVDRWKFARMDYVLASPDWQLTDGGVVAANASDHRPVWLIAHGKPAPTTQPVAQR